VSGIEGVTYLTADLPAMERFYGHGAGLAEVPAGPERTRFAVGQSQWIEFQGVRDSGWPRRLQYVTLETPSLQELERALRARGVATRWMAPGSGARVLLLEDPAGNLIQFAGPWTPPPVLREVKEPFSGHLQHFGLAVARARAEATMAFYRDTLGWPEAARGSDSEGRLDMVKFRLPGKRNERIELILFDPPLNKWASGAFDHVNFEVGDIDGAYRSLHEGGIASLGGHLPRVNGEHLWAVDIIDPELTRMEVQVLLPTDAPIGTVSTLGGHAPKPLFDGKTLAGWEGDTQTWRVEDGAIVAGRLDRVQPHNDFLETTEDFGNFDLRLQYRIAGTGGFVNGGVQFWSQRIAENFEVSGYQADLGANTDGNLYDESRRNRNLATAPDDVRQHALVTGDWNNYRIRAEGAHIQIWLNGIRTVDYTESDGGIARHGRFALQIHGGASTRVSYRDLMIEALP
jgi:catechol 2,3-dioxygenase-like lactoylglutathione lyase family enzyme